MRISIYIKLDEEKLKNYTPNAIFEYAELIEVLREHGFVHRTSSDNGFINNNATEDKAKKAILDALERLGWLNIDGLITECRVEEVSETTDLTHLLKDIEK